MRGVNKAILMGNLTRDPELKDIGNGSSVCKFSVATGRQWKDQQGQMQEDVQYHNVVAWSKLAQISAQYLHKGSPVYVEGRIVTRKYTDKNQIERYSTEIVADNVVFLPSGNKQNSQPTTTSESVADDVEAGLNPPQQNYNDIFEV